jgi:hypothetical protein
MESGKRFESVCLVVGLAAFERLDLDDLML